MGGTMRTTKKRLPIPQHEFGITADTFRLFTETGVDGERISRERAEVEEARRTAEKAQASLFSNPQPVNP